MSSTSADASSNLSPVAPPIEEEEIVVDEECDVVHFACALDFDTYRDTIGINGQCKFAKVKILADRISFHDRPGHWTHRVFTPTFPGTKGTRCLHLQYHEPPVKMDNHGNVTQLTGSDDVQLGMVDGKMQITRLGPMDGATAMRKHFGQRVLSFVLPKCSNRLRFIRLPPERAYIRIDVQSSRLLGCWDAQTETTQSIWFLNGAGGEKESGCHSGRRVLACSRAAYIPWIELDHTVTEFTLLMEHGSVGKIETQGRMCIKYTGENDQAKIAEARAAFDAHCQQLTEQARAERALASIPQIPDAPATKKRSRSDNDARKRIKRESSTSDSAVKHEPANDSVQE